MQLGISKIWGKINTILAPGAAKTATYTSAAIDLQKYKSLVAVVVDCAQGTGNADNTLIPSFTECATTGGSYVAAATTPVWYLGSDLTTTVASITGTGGTYAGPIVAFVDPRAMKEFVKLVLTIAGTNPSYYVTSNFVGTEEYPT